MSAFFSKNTSDSDAELIRQYQSSQDMDILGELYSRYMDLVFGVCVKYLKKHQ